MNQVAKVLNVIKHENYFQNWLKYFSFWSSSLDQLCKKSPRESLPYVFEKWPKNLVFALTSIIFSIIFFFPFSSGNTCILKTKMEKTVILKQNMLSEHSASV